MATKQFLCVVHMPIMGELKTVANMASTSKKNVELTIHRRRIRNGIL